MTRRPTQYAALLLGAVICGLASAQDYTTFKYGSQNNFIVQMRALVTQDPQVLEMKVCFPLNRWFGFGIGGSQMYDSELVFFMAPPDSTLQKVVATRMLTQKNTRPNYIPSEQTEIYKTISKVENSPECGEGNIDWTVHRLLNTDGKNGNNISFSIPIGTEIPMSAAGQEQNPMADYNLIVGHPRGGFVTRFKITIDTDGSINNIKVFDFYLLHGIILSVSWGLLALLQLSSSRYLKMYVSVSMWTHRISGFLIFLATLVIALLTFNRNNWKLDDGLHPALGLTVVCCVSALTIGGIVARMLLEKTTWNTLLAVRIKMGHKLFGYLVLLVSQVALLTGGLKYGSNNRPLAKTLVILEIVLFTVLIVIFEVLFQIYKRKEQPFREVQERISRQEFDQMISRGEKLVLLDDMVLDVTKFRSEHPGGQFLIDFHIGRDVSKFFYGGYVLENQSGMSPYTHSNVARAIVNSMIIGKLNEASETFEGHISHSYNINKNSKVFTFVVDTDNVHYKPPASTSVETIGKHYLLRSLNNPKVRRHYTVSQCMRLETYQEYLGLIQQFNQGSRNHFNFNEEVLVENSSKREIIFTAKNYAIVGGLSQILHNSTFEEKYQMKALLGKGLNLQPEGVHVAFAGGTGVLVFMDLVALLLRQNTGLLNNKPSIKIFEGKTFKFVLYASFPSREDAVGLELLEGLRDVTKGLGLTNFHLELRFGNEARGTRWDREFIMRNIQIWKKEGLTKAYVCGPPIMNELFDRTIDSLIQQRQLERSVVEVL